MDDDDAATTAADLVAAISAAAYSYSSSSVSHALYKLKSLVRNVLERNVLADMPGLRVAVDSLYAALAGGAAARYPAGIGRAVGMMMLACGDEREGLVFVHRELMMAGRSELGSGIDEIEDVVVRVKTGDEDGRLGAALAELGCLVREGLVGSGEEEMVVRVLLGRLGSVEDGNCRCRILRLLRAFASRSDQNKETMAGLEALSIIGGCLARNVDEDREVVGLLLDLSEIAKVRQRIGRVQGCIVKLVALLNGDDPSASSDAGKLLGALSSNTQNVLLMAEAGFFASLVQYLKEGSYMDKILMATAISRMELTDQMKAALGEEGSIDPLAKMIGKGKFEAKLSALGALRNLSSLPENIPRLIDSGIVASLLQLLFAVTSIMVTLREPAAAILASIAKSELILTKKDAPQQMLSLLNLSNPKIQLHLLHALNSITGHSLSFKVRNKMKENGAVQLLLPFLTDSNAEIRLATLNTLLNISNDFTVVTTEQLGEVHLKLLVHLISTSMLDSEKATAVGILSNIPLSDRKATEILSKTNLLPALVSLVELNTTDSTTPTRMWLLESISSLLIRFTVPSDKKVQRLLASHGVIHCLLKILSTGTAIAKAGAATSLAQLSQNSLPLVRVKSPRWYCLPPSSEAFCEVHNGYCFVKSTFCLIKAGAIPLLVDILEDEERIADEAALTALATLMQDEIWENGSNAIVRASGVEAILRVLEVGSLKVKAKALWMLERIFRIDAHSREYGEAAKIVLSDLAQNGDPSLKPMVGNILAHLQDLQMSFF